MWYAIAAKEVIGNLKEIKKEYQHAEKEIIASANSKPELEKILIETKSNFPKQFEKYLHAGIKIIEANSPGQAKKKAESNPIYFDNSGQYKFL